MDFRPRSARIEQGRWVVEEIGFATGRVLLAGQRTEVEGGALGQRPSIIAR